jgi:hypothetical protein
VEPVILSGELFLGHIHACRDFYFVWGPFTSDFPLSDRLIGFGC